MRRPGRPLRVAPKLTAAGTWSVEVPVARGAKQRKRRTFPTLEQAQSWAGAAEAALRDGLQVPDPVSPAAEAATPKPVESVPEAAVTFEQVAEAWITEYYELLNRAEPGRRRDVRGMVRRNLLPFMQSHGLTSGAEVTRDLYLEASLLWHRGDGTPAAPVPVSGADVTLEEAIDLCQASRSTLKRRVKLGELPGTYIDADGRRRIPRAALHAAGLMGDEPLRRGRRTVAERGYCTDRAGDIVWCFRKVLQHGEAIGAWTLQFDPGRVPNPKPERQPAKRRRQLELSECVAIAAHLHPVHQLVLWLLRLLSLRISEAYGIHLRDVVDDGDRGLVRIHRQGGRGFAVDAGSHPQRAQTKETLKTAASTRVLIVPRPLLELIRAAIDVFHTDADGHVRRDARLIPGLRMQDHGGQESFRSALRAAALAAGVHISGDDRHLEDVLLPVPKDMRAGTITDLAWAGLDELLRKRWAGHTAGSDVHSRAYVLDHPDVAKLLPVARALEDLMAQAAPDGLIVPTHKSCTTGSQKALAADAARIDSALLQLGWRAAAQPIDGRPAMTVQQAAQLFGKDDKTVRRWAQEGRFGEAVQSPTAYLLPADGVLAEYERVKAQRRLPEVATTLGVPYHTVFWWVRREGLPLDKQPNGDLLVPPDTEQRLTAIADEHKALTQRAACIDEAAYLMGVTPVAVECLIRTGGLSVDPERGPRGARYVTRSSIEALMRRTG